MISKIHESGDKRIVSICDEELLGKIFEENDFVLDLSSNFYMGEKIDQEVLLKALKGSYLVNAVGEKSTDFLIKNNIISKDNLSHISKIPFIQVVFN